MSVLVLEALLYAITQLLAEVAKLTAAAPRLARPPPPSHHKTRRVWQEKCTGIPQEWWGRHVLLIAQSVIPAHSNSTKYDSLPLLKNQIQWQCTQQSVDPRRSRKRRGNSICTFAILKLLLHAHFANLPPRISKIRLCSRLLDRMPHGVANAMTKPPRVRGSFHSSGVSEGYQAAVECVEGIRAGAGQGAGRIL